MHSNIGNQPPGRGITLRCGIFFDGTGNNLSNSQRAAACRAWSAGGTLDEAGQAFCRSHGFDDQGGAPSDSYGNEPSNIAHLYQLYRDQSEQVLAADQQQAALAVYVEGVGTTADSSDSLYAQSTGRWSTGVMARVEQTPAAILDKLERWRQHNPGVQVVRWVFDLFGFSRGAAEARHFANDLLKGHESLLAQQLPAGAEVLASSFAWRIGSDVQLNFIGLFDTVAAIISPLACNFRAGNASYGGLQLALANGAARRVVQLVASDELRENFALTRTDDDILLPGAHADLGGGYWPRQWERVLLCRPDSSQVSLLLADAESPACERVEAQLQAQGAAWRAQGLAPELVSWSVPLAFNRWDDIKAKKRVFAAVQSAREVRGELSRVYLRIMRAWAVQYDVPFAAIDGQAHLAIPLELRPIAAKLQAFALGETAQIGLDASQHELLYRRYVHRSAHWGAPGNTAERQLDAVFIHRPAPAGRALHGNC